LRWRTSHFISWFLLTRRRVDGGEQLDDGAAVCALTQYRDRRARYTLSPERCMIVSYTLGASLLPQKRPAACHSSKSRWARHRPIDYERAFADG
jgi:hypothetical protein